MMISQSVPTYDSFIRILSDMVKTYADHPPKSKPTEKSPKITKLSSLVDEH
ncbi:hypothetical protein [Tumebacillus flagellatus]|uniref:hypothetical protein n=1 Tax=Tumebacillus flagellatus TaxID=1157490 RepID=UPI001378FB93|nr:hypothetical protein [Tumebacillus flagellatus]